MMLCVSLFMVVSELRCFSLSIMKEKGDGILKITQSKNIFCPANHFLEY